MLTETEQILVPFKRRVMYLLTLRKKTTSPLKLKIINNEIDGLNELIGYSEGNLDFKPI